MCLHASNVVAAVRPGLLCFLRIKLGETGPDLLASGDGLGRELDRFVRVGCLDRNRFAPSIVMSSGSNELACRTIAVSGRTRSGVGAHCSTRAANAAGSIVEDLFLRNRDFDAMPRAPGLMALQLHALKSSRPP
jgi:hypothetical protein